MATPRSLIPVLLALAVAPIGLHASGDPYEAPPLLPYYLDRLPAKPLGQIFAEHVPAPAPVGKTDYAARLLAVADLPPERALPVIDDLLTRARHEPADAGPRANLLHDARDLFAATPPAGAGVRAEYLRWRLGHADWFGLSSPPGADRSAATTAPRLAELERRAREAGGEPLAAHWQYLAGALLFRAGDDAGAQGWFERVAADHPRAEAARYMAARCELSRSRPGLYETAFKPDAESHRAAARAGFEDYLKRYPDGRFAADVPGWLGASRFDAGDYLGALGDYVRQAEAARRGHPEVLKSAAFMAERCLSHLASTGDDAGLRAVAAQPPLALGLVYLVLNSPEADNFNGHPDAPATVAKWRRALLPRLGREIAARPELYRGADWEGPYLAALVQAASGAGDQGRALELAAMAPPGLLAKSDDLAFARAVALARAGKLADAVAAYREFLARFPEGPLTKGARLRLVLALQDDHQAGAAVVELIGLRDALREEAQRRTSGQNGDGYHEAGYLLDGQTDRYPSSDAGLNARRSVILPDPSGAEPEPVGQLLDALLNFAPRPELAAAWAALPEGATRVLLGGVLAERALAEDEAFPEARRYLTPAQWEAVAPVAAAHGRPPTAENLLALGDAWAAARGRLTFQPLQASGANPQAVSGEGNADDRDRRENALALGLAEARVNAALAGRDELCHARAHWQRAADAAPAGSPLRARALWQALSAVPKVALVSPYTLARAGETDLAGESRKLYDRLRRECPDSREARELAVFYDFPRQSATTVAGRARSDVEATGETDPWSDLAERSAQQHAGFPVAPPEEDSAWHQNSGTPLLARVAALPGLAGEPARLRDAVADLRRGVRERVRVRADTVLLNCLDDLADLLAKPTISPGAARRYVGLRLEVLHTAAGGGFAGGPLPPVPGGDHLTGDANLDDLVLSHVRAAYREPALAPFKDYLDALAIAIVANHDVNVPVPGVEKDGAPLTRVSRDYPKLVRLCEGFQKDYPRSRRREAVSLLHARALLHAGEPGFYRRFAGWPESGHYAGGWILGEHRQTTVDPRTIGAAFNAHEREFPRGRYGNEIRHLRASLAWRTQQWDVALRLTLAELDDAKNVPDLQAEATARLESIFVTLATDDTERARLMAVIRAQPGAPERLRSHLETAPLPLALVKTWALGELR